MSIASKVSYLINFLHNRLFPFLESHLKEEFTEDHKNVAAVLETVEIERSLPCTKFNFGRPCKYRLQIARAFVAKAVLKIQFTTQLIERLKRDTNLRILCGWEPQNKIPSEATFSRVFEEFARISLPDISHQLLIKNVYEGEIVGHTTKDSTPLHAREAPLKKKGSRKERKAAANKKSARIKQGKELGRRQKQLLQRNDLNGIIQDLPRACDIGMKTNASGYMSVWKGYKLHVSVDDHCIPLAALLTSASLNDSEAAIPLAEKTSKLVSNFYDLMDAAYDEIEIKEHSKLLGHVPIIDFHARSKHQKKEKEERHKAKIHSNKVTAEERRYQERFSKERFNALFKDFYGGRQIFVKGHDKIFCHAMFGILALTATCLLKFG